MTQQPISSLALLALVATATLAAQDVVPGYHGGVDLLPDGAGQVLVLEDRDAVVWFDGTRLVLREGASTRNLLVLPSPTFGAFTIRVDEGTLLFGDSGSGDLWLLPLQSDHFAPRVLATTTFPFDAVLFDRDTVVVSAKTGGFASADNDLLALNVSSGALTRLAVLPGASGPVAANGAGLFYATASNAFPAPPGSTDVLLFPRASVRAALGRRMLGATDATVVAAGFDSAADLSVDREGDLFLVDFIGARVVEWDRRTGATRTFVGYAPGAPSASGLQLTCRGGGAAAFEPYQPDGPQTLYVHESVFGGASRLRAVSPERPSLAVATATPVPPAPTENGTLALIASGLPANGTAIAAIGLGVGPLELPFGVPGFDQPLFFAPVLLHSLAHGRVAPIAADGTLSVTLPWRLPPRSPLPIAAQVAFVDAGGTVVGSTPPVRVR